PAMLDKLLSTGQFIMVGAPDQSVAFHHIDTVDLTLPIHPTQDRLAIHEAILTALTGTGGWFFAALAAQLNYPSEELLDALWDLFWAGQVTNDTFSAVRATYTKSTTRAQPQRTPMRHRARLRRLNRLAPTQPPSPTTAGRWSLVPQRTPMRHRARLRRLNRLAPTQPPSPTTVGRWSLVPQRTDENTAALHAQAEYLLDRYGVITRGAVTAEALPGGFAAYYRLLS